MRKSPWNTWKKTRSLVLKDIMKVLPRHQKKNIFERIGLACGWGSWWPWAGKPICCDGWEKVRHFGFLFVWFLLSLFMSFMDFSSSAYADIYLETSTYLLPLCWQGEVQRENTVKTTHICVCSLCFGLLLLFSRINLWPQHCPGVLPSSRFPKTDLLK